MSARVVELEDLEGRKISVDIIALRDDVLTFRHLGNASLHHFPVAQLSERSVQAMHEQMTETLVPSLKVVTQERSRKTETHWRTYWGSYDKTTTLARAFTVKVDSTSSFQKKVYVYVYWIRGRNISYSTWEATVGGGKEFVTDISASGQQRDERYRAIGERYVTGTDLIEPVVLVKDRHGKVLASWANLKFVEDIVHEQTASDEPY